MRRFNELPPLLIFLAITAFAAAASRLNAAEKSQEPAIPRVAKMPDLPGPFAMRDWSKVTRDYIDFVFDFDRRGDHLPLVRWLKNEHKMVSLPSYVGGPRDPEAINFLAAVVSGTLVGIDMRNLSRSGLGFAG